MKKYLNLNGFIEFIKNLKEDVYTDIYAESLEGDEVKYIFCKTTFNDRCIILYDHPYGGVGIIQDTLDWPSEDYVEGLFEDMEGDDFKVFIKE